MGPRLNSPSLSPVDRYSRMKIAGGPSRMSSLIHSTNTGETLSAVLHCAGLCILS